jgi:M6 family metalloprotease-like protein
MTRRLLACLAVLSGAVAIALGTGSATGATAPPAASTFDFVRFPTPQPLCTGAGLRGSPYFTRDDCGFGEVTLAGVPESATVQAVLKDSSGATVDTVEATFDSADTWQYDITPASGWKAGPIAVRVQVDGQPATGEGTFYVNQLAVELAPKAKTGGYQPGDDIALTGTVSELQSVATDTRQTGVPGSFRLRVVDARGTVLGITSRTFTANDDGTVDATIPGTFTAGVHPGPDTGFREALRLETVDAAYDDPTPGRGGTWAAPDGTAAGSADVTATPDQLVLENSFVSSKGWVKPGDEYPFTVRVLNYQPTAKPGGTVTVTVPDGATLLTPETWTVGDVPAATADGPGVTSKVFTARAKSLTEDPKIVWKDLSATATPSGSATGVRAHGPKVIPPRGGYDTARYGDRPFPVVPVDYSDRAHGTGSSADKLASKINDPGNPGSTFNLYQEMSYGQLFPHGTVPSDGIAARGWRYGPGFGFTKNAAKANTCHGVTNANLPGDTYQQLQPNRIQDGWYQLPGSTDYYGDDSNGSALIGALGGVGALQDIDSACGPTGKAVYDAAQIADPEIDYNDYDTDKDGVVDFFMMVFAGLGGNGDSQLNGTPPYDNIWPHSSDLQNGYVDPDTGEKGYVSDDQLTDLEGRKLYWTDASRTKQTTDPTSGIPVHVRVGPYNVNPETAIAKASVISHEYGHSLGLPDYYSTGSRETYGTWMLMAEDHSQDMDVIGKKELGWLVPRVLEPGQTRTAAGWKDTKVNTHRIDWKQPDGTPYTLKGDGVDNGEGYVATLPGRQIIDPKLVPSGDHVWWSQSGNDFGCPPAGGHNLDIALPALRDVAPGTPVTLSFKSRWDIEWDYDYGFVLSTTDNGASYHSYPSQKGYTTAVTDNPNQNSCQGQYGNGLTGSSGSYQQGTQTVDRVAGNYPDAPFVDDAYDISDLAGKAATLRLSYATDPGLARPGWFIDDLTVKAGDQVIYSSDFESANDPALYPGGCREGLQTAQKCTDGWQYASASDGSPAEHAYLMEMRDRSGFDAHGMGEDDRDPPGITFQPGMLLAYTDENHGYGNVGTDDPPAQSPLDSQPQPGSDTPNLDDAAFTALSGDSRFSDSGDGHVDNYSDASRADGQWRFDFDCLSFDVTRMAGQDIDPAARNLDGDVRFTTGQGCGRFDYGNGAPSAGEPTQPPVTPPRQEQKPGQGDGNGNGNGNGGQPAGGPAGPASGPTTGERQCARTARQARARTRSHHRRITITGVRSVTVTRAATKRRVTKRRVVAHPRVRRGGSYWRGRHVGDGTYILRLRTATFTRKLVVDRRHGRLHFRKGFVGYGCDSALRKASLSSPAFGGSIWTSSMLRGV